MFIGVAIESTTFDMRKATNVSVQQDTYPQFVNTLGKQLQQCKNPFIPDIMEATLLSNWKSLAIKKYDGTIDPDEHLDIYITQVRLYTIDGVVLCWVFPTSLKG